LEIFFGKQSVGKSGKILGENKKFLALLGKLGYAMETRSRTTFSLT
jgi:hypothetical protein